MHPVLVITLATAAAVSLGLWLRRDLGTLTYRIDDERDLPAPGARWWVVWSSVLAIGGIATAAIVSGNPFSYLPLLPLAMSGPWLAAVDFDVMRIPNRVLAPTAVLTLLAVVDVASVTQNWLVLVAPAGAALLTGGIFAVVHFASGEGIGFGDVKLAAVIGLSLGTLGWGAALLAIVAGSIAAFIWAKATHRTGPFPYGPWLLLGDLLAAVLAGLAP